MRLLLLCLCALCPVLSRLQAQSTDTLLRALSTGVNTAADEHAPALAADGNTLYYLREHSPRNMGQDDSPDVWVSYRGPAGGWSRGVNLGAPVNSRSRNGLLSVSPSGNRLYLRSQAPDGSTRIRYSDRVGRRWSGPYVLPVADRFYLGPHSSLSLGPDNRHMIISQARPEAPEQYDLYYSRRDPWGVWQRPVPLGPTVNSPGQERKVHLAADGRTLYFSSNGHGAGPDTDILVSRRRGDSWTDWSPPRPLGPVFSTPDDDDHFTLSAAGDRIMLARRNGSGHRDLFWLPLPDSLAPEGVCLVSGSLDREGSIRPEHLRIDFFPEENTRVPSKSIPLDPAGEFSAILSQRAGRGLLLVRSASHFPQAFQLPDPNPDPQSLDRESERLMAYLRQDRAYRNREEDILQLYQRYAEVEDQIAEIDQQLNLINNPPEGWWPRLDSTRLAAPEVEAVRIRFREHFGDVEPGETEPDTTAGPDSLSEIAARMQVVRDRFLRIRRNGTSDGEGAEGEEGEAPTETGAKDFPTLARGYWEQRRARVAPRVRYQLEEAMLVGMLEQEESERRPDATKIEALSARLATVRERLEDILGRPPRPWPSVSPWEDSLRVGLGEVLDPVLEVELEEALRPRLEEYIQLYRRKFNRIRQRQNAQENLDELLVEQIQREQELMERVPPDSFALRVQAHPFDSLYREERIRLDLKPFTLGQQHVARGVRFYANTAMLQPHSYEELDHLVQLLRENPALGLVITCHAHPQLTHVKAQSLTRSRARTLSAFFQGQGIPTHRLRLRGVGKLRPLVPDDSLSGQRANQRITVQVFLAAG